MGRKSKAYIEKGESMMMVPITTVARLAIKKEKSRGKKERARDEKSTSKNVLTLNGKNYYLWKTRMNRLDLKGVDTKGGIGAKPKRKPGRPKGSKNKKK